MEIHKNHLHSKVIQVERIRKIAQKVVDLSGCASEIDLTGDGNENSQRQYYQTSANTIVGSSVPIKNVP